MSEVDKLLDENQQKIRETISLGVEAENFLKSDLAKFIENAAEMKMMSALEGLKTVNPTDTTEIIRLQAIVSRYEHYDTYLRELVAAGDVAHGLYLQEHNLIEE